jgi:hypothetical protein
LANFPAFTRGDDRQDAGLTLADLVPYRAALEGKPAEPAVAVTFRALWDHAAQYQGRRVQVEGRVARRFRQDAFGEFPPLVEAWAMSPAGDPFCLVYPVPAKQDRATPSGRDASPGASVRFEGTYLRRITYQGGDVARVALLIVGDRPPIVIDAVEKGARGAVGLARRDHDRSWLDWTIGLVAAAFVALVLAHRHLTAPSRKPLRIDREIEPAPEFVDPEVE